MAIKRTAKPATPKTGGGARKSTGQAPAWTQKATKKAAPKYTPRKRG